MVLTQEGSIVDYESGLGDSEVFEKEYSKGVPVKKFIKNYPNERQISLFNQKKERTSDWNNKGTLRFGVYNSGKRFYQSEAYCKNFLSIMFILFISLSGMAQTRTVSTLDLDNNFFQLSTTVINKDPLWKAISITVKEGMPSRKSAHVLFETGTHTLECEVDYVKETKTYTLTINGTIIVSSTTIAAIRESAKTRCYQDITGYAPKGS